MFASKFDIVKAASYLTAFAFAVTPADVNIILAPFHLTTAQADEASKIIAATVVTGALIANTIRNPTPPIGTTPILVHTATGQVIQPLNLTTPNKEN